MRGVKATFSGAVLALVLASGPGCYVMVGPPAIGVVPGGPPPAAAPQMQQFLGVGASGGIMVAADPWLEPGPYVGAHVSLWLSPFLGVELGVGATAMTDTYYGGEMTIVPATVSAVLSIPDWSFGYTGDWARHPFRWRLGLGAGAVGLDHTVHTLSETSMAVFTAQFGVEFVVPPSAGLAMRLLFVVDAMGGSVVSNMDLSTLTAARVGLELGF